MEIIRGIAVRLFFGQEKYQEIEESIHLKELRRLVESITEAPNARRLEEPFQISPCGTDSSE